jgi:transcriptional regulator with XRE-family HTH domain
MNVGKSLKVALAKAGLSQRQLAAKLGCGPGWVSRLANRASADIRTIEQLAAAFDMKVGEFILLGED